jgi:hypothetical protein
VPQGIKSCQKYEVLKKMDSQKECSCNINMLIIDFIRIIGSITLSSIIAALNGEARKIISEILPRNATYSQNERGYHTQDKPFY